ncbi:MAG: hypothetical protein AAGF99_09515 [Bacteroidota bacterium]
MRPAFSYPLVFLGALALAACATPEPDATATVPAPGVTMPDLVTPDVITVADSLAMLAYDHAGGPAAWARVGALRFDFAVERAGERTPIRHHLWDRTTGAYRIDWSNGDTLYTALFDVDDYTTGTVYMDGAPLRDSTLAEALDNAEQAYLNDTYWLLAPIKLFDAGVTRGLDADSSDATTAALTLAFDGVGLTPGDTYWIYVNRDTGAVEGWTFQLESGGIGQYDWMGYDAFNTAAGPVRLAVRKERADGFALLTDALALPTDLDPAVFTDPALRLDGRTPKATAGPES